MKFFNFLLFWRKPKQTTHSLLKGGNWLDVHARDTANKISYNLTSYQFMTWQSQGYIVDQNNKPIFTIDPTHEARKQKLLEKWQKSHDNSAAWPFISNRRSAVFSVAYKLPARVVINKDIIDDPRTDLIGKDFIPATGEWVDSDTISKSEIKKKS